MHSVQLWRFRCLSQLLLQTVVYPTSWASGWLSRLWKHQICWLGGWHMRSCTPVWHIWLSTSTLYQVSQIIDILNMSLIPALASTVDVEQLFSRGCILINHLCNCLHAASIRALMCFGDWCCVQFVTDGELAAALCAKAEKAKRKQDKARCHG